MCFGIICITCAVRTENFIFSIIFRKIREIPYSHNTRNSTGNNSGSAEDRAVKFAYSKGFSAMTDRMVLPTSLSRDRKWPRPPIPRITAHACNSVSMQAGTVDNGPENEFRHHLHHFCGTNGKFQYFPLFFAKIRYIPYFRSVKLKSAILRFYKR